MTFLAVAQRFTPKTLQEKSAGAELSTDVLQTLRLNEDFVSVSEISTDHFPPNPQEFSELWCNNEVVTATQRELIAQGQAAVEPATRIVRQTLGVRKAAVTNGVVALTSGRLDRES